MTTRAEILIDWSREATEKGVAGDHLSRQLVALALILKLRAYRLNPIFQMAEKETLLVARIVGIIKIINPQLDSDLKPLEVNFKKSSEKETETISFAEFYRKNIFNFKMGIVRRLQSLSKVKPHQNSSLREKEIFSEKVIEKWCEVLNPPSEILTKTRDGVFIHLEEEDLISIKNFIESTFQDFSEKSGLQYKSPWDEGIKLR